MRQHQPPAGVPLELTEDPTPLTFWMSGWSITALIQTYLVQHGWCPQQRLTFLRWCFVMRKVIQGRSLVLRVKSCTSRRSICLSTRTQTLQSSSRRSAVRLSHSWSGSICHDLSCLKQSIIRFIRFIWPNHIWTTVFSCSVFFCWCQSWCWHRTKPNETETQDALL